MHIVVGYGLTPMSAPLQRCFFSGGLPISLWLRRVGWEAGGGCSRFFGLDRDQFFTVWSCLAYLRLRVGGSEWLLWVNGGLPLQVQGVVRLEIKFLGSRCFTELGFSLYWCGVCRWILLPRRRVVGLSRFGAQAQWLARGLKDVRCLCHLSGRMLRLLTSNLFFAVRDMFSRLDNIWSRHLL